MPFENWSSGEELFDNLDKEHDLLDRDLRPFAEEADQMQGIQIMASMDDAWGGFAAMYIDRLRDEYGKTAIWIWGLEDSLANTPRVSQLLRAKGKLLLTVLGQAIPQAIQHGSIIVRSGNASICLYPSLPSLRPSSFLPQR